MSIPKKGLRKIVVSNKPYRWLIRRQASNAQADYPGGCLYVAIQLADNPSSVLVIITDRPHPAGFTLQSEIVPVTPADIEAWILQSLMLGWMPSKSGKYFKVRVVENCLEKI